jgi:hypothetical protein
MERGNEFAKQLDMDNVPVMGSFDFDNIRMRCGDMNDPNSGEKVGVIIEWWFIPLPWFRFRMKLENLHAAAFYEKFGEVLHYEEPPSASS